MKVLFVSSGRKKQVGVIVSRQGESLMRSGIDVDFLLAGPGLSGYLSAIGKIRRAWNTGNYDLIHAHYSLSAFTASLAGNFPLVVSLMGSDLYMSGVMRLVIRMLYSYRWDAIIVKSLQMKETLKFSKAKVIPNGVDTEMFRPVSKAEAREFLGCSGPGNLILFGSSSDRPEKNAALARGAFRLLNNPEVEFRYLSGIPHDQVPYWMNAADVLVLTSKWEGSPNVVKEAMACNCPIVATNVGDISWVMGTTEGCLLAEADENDLAQKMRQVLERGRRTDGRERIMSLGLSAGKIAERIKLVYCDVLERHR